MLITATLIAFPFSDAKADRAVLLNFGVNKSGVRASNEGDITISRKAGVGVGIGFEILPQSDFFFGVAYNRRGMKAASSDVNFRFDVGYFDVFACWRGTWDRDKDSVLLPYVNLGFFYGIETHCGISSAVSFPGVSIGLDLDCDTMVSEFGGGRREFLYGGLLGAGVKLRFSDSADVCFDIIHSSSYKSLLADGIGELSQFSLNMGVEFSI